MGEMTTVEQVRREAIERLKQKRAARLAAKPVLTAPVSKRVAEAVKANPESVVIHAKTSEGVMVFDRPAQLGPGFVTVRVDLVSRVDAEGRPIYDRGVVSDYNPFSAERMGRPRE
jgi:hypothetical protein